MSTIDRQISQLIAQQRQLDREVIALRNSVVRPASWIRGVATATPTTARFFRLLEDFASNGPAWAAWVARTDNTSRGTMQVYCFDGILDGALAGYKVVVVQIDSQWVPAVNPCIETCSHSGTFSGTPADGTEGTPYGFTPTVGGLNSSSVSASGLPPGLSIDTTTGVISGTPTTPVGTA